MDCSELENEMPIDGDFSAAGSQDVKKDVDDACNICTKFCKYYYSILEKKTHLVGQLYVETAVLIWDGNPIVGRDNIQKFFEQMPCITFSMFSMDCQSLSVVAVGNTRSYLIKLAGQLRVSVVGTVKSFTQEIVLTIDDNKWRIAADNFRSQV